MIAFSFSRALSLAFSDAEIAHRPAGKRKCHTLNQFIINSKENIE